MLLFVVVLVLVRNWGERERERVWVGFSVCVFVCVLGCRLRHRAYRVLQALPRVSERRRRRYCPTARPPRDMFAPAPGRKWVNHVRNYTNPCTRIYAATAMWALLLCERASALTWSNRYFPPSPPPSRSPHIPRAGPDSVSHRHRVTVRGGRLAGWLAGLLVRRSALCVSMRLGRIRLYAAGHVHSFRLGRMYDLVSVYVCFVCFCSCKM